MSKPVISLLVPTMGNPWYLKTTINSAITHATVPIEILVYSNEHTQPTEDIIKKQQERGVPVKLVHTSPNNDGVAVAVNTMAKASSGDFLFYTADDAYLLPNWDNALLARIKEGKWQYLTPRSIEPMGKNPCMYAPFDFGRTQSTFKVNKLLEWWETHPKQDVKSCAGPPFVARWIWEAVGGFDENFYPGFGTDPDFSHSVYSLAKKDGQEAEFLGVGDCGFYHFQCITTSRIRRTDATNKSHKLFQQKWGKTTREFSKLVGDGEKI